MATTASIVKTTAYVPTTSDSPENPAHRHPTVYYIPMKKVWVLITYPIRIRAMEISCS